jgi:acyl carrier protein
MVHIILQRKNQRIKLERSRRLKHFENKILERELLGLIIEVCKISDPVPDDLSPFDALIGPDSPLGLDSLDAVEIVVSVEKKYNVHMDAQHIARKVLRSISTLADFIRQHEGSLKKQSVTDNT